MEEWFDPSVMSALAATRTGYGAAEIEVSLRKLGEMFRGLEAECRETTDYRPAIDETAVWHHFQDTLAKTSERP
jgi:hypothetical protein